MFNSQIKNIDTTNNCLASMKHYDLILSDTELSLASDFVKVLQVFEKATDLFQGESYPSLNLAVFCYVAIKADLNALLAERNVSDIIQVSATFLLDRLDHRFKITESMIVPTFLDPLMQKLRLLSKCCEEDVGMIELLLKKWYDYEPELMINPTRMNNQIQKIPSFACKLRLD